MDDGQVDLKVGGCLLLHSPCAVAAGLRHRVVRLHHHHSELEAAGRHHLLLPEPVCVGLLHHASDGGHGRVSDRAGRRLGEGELRRAAGGGDGVLRLVHLRLHGLPRRQPAAQPQGAGGVPGVPLLLRDRVDDPDVLAIAVEDEEDEGGLCGGKGLKQTPPSDGDY